MYNKIIGLDLSLSGTGMAYIDFNSRFVETGRINLGTFDKKFTGVFLRIQDVIDRLVCFSYDFDPDIISVEEALPRGQWSPGLFGLVSTVLHLLVNEMEVGIITYNPNFLDFLHSVKGHKKSASVRLAREIMEIENLHLFTKRINHNEAEAFLLAYAAAVHYGREPVILQEKFFAKKGKELRKKYI